MNLVSLKRVILVLFAFLLSACAGMAAVESKSSKSTAYRLNSIQVRWADKTTFPIFISKGLRKGPEAPVIDTSDHASAQNAVAQTTSLFSQSASQSIEKLLTPVNVRDDAEIVLALSPVNASYTCLSSGPAAPCESGLVWSFELKAVLLNDKSKSELWSARIKTKLSPSMVHRHNENWLEKALPSPAQLIRDVEVGDRSSDEVLVDRCLAKLIGTLRNDGWLAIK